MASTDKYNRVLKSHCDELISEITNDVNLGSDFTIKVLTDETESQFRTDLESMIRKELEPKCYDLYFSIDTTSYYDGNQSYGPDHKWLTMKATRNMRITRSHKKRKTSADPYDDRSKSELINARRLDDLRVKLMLSTQTDAMCSEAVKENGLALQYCELQTEYICLEAVKQNKDALEFVNDEFVIPCEEYLFDLENK